MENGKAAADALALVSAEWAAAGDAGRDVYVLQQLQRLAQAAAQRVAESEIGNIKLVAGNDKAYSAVLASYPAAVAAVLRETGEALGIDIGRLLTKGSAASHGTKRPTLPPGGIVGRRKSIGSSSPPSATSPGVSSPGVSSSGTPTQRFDQPSSTVVATSDEGGVL